MAILTTSEVLASLSLLSEFYHNTNNFHKSKKLSFIHAIYFRASQTMGRDPTWSYNALPLKEDREPGKIYLRSRFHIVDKKSLMHYFFL